MTRLITARTVLVARTRTHAYDMVRALPPETRAQLSVDWMRRLEESAESDPWIHGFTVVSRGDGGTLGQCGFKGPPGVDGIVEIAYAIDPAHQGRGYATEAAQALVGYALASTIVRVLRAHTLPETNASTRVLEKCGFRFVGPANDPEDGLVHRFERPCMRDASMRG